MDEYVSLNCNPVAANDASISAISAAALYGRGIFTSIAVYNGNPFLWDKHWRRLELGAAKLNIDLTEFLEHKTREALDQIIHKNGVVDGRARVTILDESKSDLWSFGAEQKASLLMITGLLRQVSDCFRLAASPHSVNSLSPLAGIKTCNYLEKLIAFDNAKNCGFDEALHLNERGEITSAVMANVFWLKDGQLFTPSVKTGCLPGTTREFVLENLECREVETELDELRLADAIFLTSAGLGVTPVAEFGSAKLEKVDHPILHLLPYKNTANMPEIE